MTRARCLGLACAALLMGACTREEPRWPAHAVRIEVGYALGHATEPLAHVVSHALSRTLHVPVTIAEARFAPGLVAAGVAAQAPGDGYTLLLGSSDGVALAPLLEEHLAQPIERDLCAVAMVGETPHVLIASRDLQVDNLDELVDVVRRKPGAIAYASFGTESTTHALGETFADALGLDLVHVPYRTSADALKDLLGGHVFVLFGTVQATLPSLRDGRLRAIAVSSPERLPELPDVPTFAERGLPKLTSSAWYGLFAPCGLTRDVETSLTEAAREALAGIDLASLGLRPGPKGAVLGEDFAHFVRNERVRWMRAVPLLADGTAAETNP